MNPEIIKFCKLAIVFLLFVVLLTFKNEICAEGQNSVSTYSYSNVQNKLAAFGQCDATDDYMYFSYWGKTSRVEVYDCNASFLYTIVFNDVQNGRMYIRCDQKNLYLKLRNDNVFIFCGEEMLKHMTKEDAEMGGYTDDWFRNAESRLTVEGDSIYLKDTDGQHIAQLDKPDAIISNSDPDHIINRLILTVCIILIILCIYMLRFVIKQKD